MLSLSAKCVQGPPAARPQVLSRPESLPRAAAAGAGGAPADLAVWRNPTRFNVAITRAKALLARARPRRLAACPAAGVGAGQHRAQQTEPDFAVLTDITISARCSVSQAPGQRRASCLGSWPGMHGGPPAMPYPTHRGPADAGRRRAGGGGPPGRPAGGAPLCGQTGACSARRPCCTSRLPDLPPRPRVAHTSLEREAGPGRAMRVCRLTGTARRGQDPNWRSLLHFCARRGAFRGAGAELVAGLPRGDEDGARPAERSRPRSFGPAAARLTRCDARGS